MKAKLFKWRKKEKPVPVPEDTRRWFEVDPDKMYPAMLNKVRSYVTQGLRPENPALAALYNQAVLLPDWAWDIAQSKTVAECSQDERIARGCALEIARLWFTEETHQGIGYAPMGLHILKSTRWRL
jgi:hypothetical protein